MADTDEQSVDPDPTHAQGADDGPESASERRLTRARERRDERLAAMAGLTPEEEALRLEEERQQRHVDEEIEAAHEDLELHERRRLEDDQLAAEADVAKAMQLADVDEATRNQLRDLAGAALARSRDHRAHGNHLLDQAAAEPDQPGAAATAAAGRRNKRIANTEESKAESYDRAADEEDARARARRAGAESARQPGQPPAVDAVRNPPPETPVARKFVRERPPKKQRLDQEEDPHALRHKGLGR
jgi:hypothetical protein